MTEEGMGVQDRDWYREELQRRRLEQLEEERLRFTLRLESLQKRLRGVKPVRLLHPT